MDSGLKYIRSLCLCFLFPAAHPGRLGHGGQNDADPQRMHDARSREVVVWVQVSLNTVLLGYSPPGSVACGSKLTVFLVGEFRRVRHQGRAVCFARDLAVGVVDLWPRFTALYIPVA